MDTNTLLIVVGVTALVLLIVLGKRFFVALWEIITAPGAGSVGFHGKENTFFFALMVVLLGGLIGVLILTYQQDKIAGDFTKYATATGHAIAQGNSNSIYRETAATWGSGKIDVALQTYVVQNFIWLPIYVIGLWIVVGFFFWLFAKMFGSQASMSAFLGSLSFAYFFCGIALALILPAAVMHYADLLFQQPPALQPDLPLIIGGILVLYSFIVFAMGVIQSAEISGGQFIVCFLLFAILVGGGSYYVETYQIQPKAEAFTSQVTSFDPSQKGWSGPDNNAPAAPPPSAPSAPASGGTENQPPPGGGGGISPSGS